MKKIILYIQDYMAKAHWGVHGLSVVFLTLLIAVNYSAGLNAALLRLSFYGQLLGWAFLLLAAFAVPYLLYLYFIPMAFEWRTKFVLLLFAAPLLFAWKMAAPVRPFSYFADAAFWNAVVYFPAKVAVVCLGLLVLRSWAGKDGRMMGLRTPATGMQPYYVMLLLMVPLIALAATRPDFQSVYPKLQHVLPRNSSFFLPKMLLFEAAYGSDFFTIELFFRGFLVIYFARWAGRYAILPMALFYCVIHFGKPLGECISSFFGGMLLGIVSYRTGSIWGGLVVHLGIAWLMEAMPGIIKV